MTAETILEELTARGARIRAEGETLKINAPAGVLSDQDKEALRAHKPEILSLLAAAEKCGNCGADVRTDDGGNWRHSQCEKGCFDVWEAREGQKLRATAGKVRSDLFNAGRAMVRESLDRGACPDCGEPLKQTERGNALICATCQDSFTFADLNDFEQKTAELTPRQWRGIEALISATTVTAAAAASGLGESTLRRWTLEPAFAEAYKAARARVLENTLNALQAASASAVATLKEVMSDADSKGAERVSAARAILEFSLKAREVLEVEERLARLEAQISTKPANLRRIK